MDRKLTKAERERTKARLKAYIRVTPRGCWIWLGSFRGSYSPVIMINGVIQNARRLVYALFTGRLPPDRDLWRNKEVCRNKKCINPDHMRIGTRPKPSGRPRS